MQNIEQARLKVALVARSLKADPDNVTITYAELEGAALILEEVAELLFNVTGVENA